MARLASIALWCAWTVAAWEAGKKQGQDGWLDDHNYYRCLHGADPVTWDSTLESQAQAVADAMPPMAHSDSYNAPMPAGENLAMGMGTFTCGDYTGPYNQNCATHNWYEEYECWGSGDDGWKNPSCTIGHLTAMIWKKTTKIGCASNGNYFVCQYGAEPPNLNSGSCATNECVEAANYDEASCKAGIPGDALGCSNVYTPMSGACRGTDPTTGAQVNVNGKFSQGCDINGSQKACGGAGQPTCEMTQAECEAGCAAENAIAPGRCEAYHWAPGGWCAIYGPHVHEGIGWDATAGAAAADSCWTYWPGDAAEVTGTNTHTEYVCYMLNDKTVNNVCGSNTCDNTCMYANDGDCDDGQPGSKYSICACGTDCSDCGSRASCGTSGTNDWGTGNGWCSSDLDDHVGDTSTASACWTMCENTYGSDLTAIDWTPDGECYCQDDCQCMEDADDGDIHLITSSAVASLPNTCVSACPAEEAAFQTCLSMQWPLDDDYFADDDDDDDDDFAPNTCDDVQQWLSTGECADGPAVCRAEYNAWVECHYEDMAREEIGQACDFTCSAGTCRGQTACDWDGSPCAADEFCNFDGGSVGSCEKCSDEDHCDRGLPSKGEADCEACCGIKKESNRDNVMILIAIICGSVAGVCCLLALGTAAAFGAFGSCACFAKKKKTPTRVAEPSAPSAPVPLVVAQYAEPPPMSPGTFAKTQEHIRRTAALMAEAPPSPQGPPPLAPIKATETLPAEMP